MSSKTTNYNLHKIDLADSPPDITVLNQNFDTIDVKLKEANDDLSNANAHISNNSNPHGVTLAQLGVNASATELNYIKGVTSYVQTQLNNKAASSHGTHVTYSTTAPAMDGTASPGSASTVARSDHKHPTDTSRAAASDLTSHTNNKNTPHGVTAEQVGALPMTGGNLEGVFGVAYSSFVENNPNARATIKQGTDGDIGFYNEYEDNVYCGIRVQPITADTTDISNLIRFRIRNNNFNHM